MLQQVLRRDDADLEVVGVLADHFGTSDLREVFLQAAYCYLEAFLGADTTNPVVQHEVERGVESYLHAYVVNRAAIPFYLQAVRKHIESSGGSRE